MNIFYILLTINLVFFTKPFLNEEFKKSIQKVDAKQQELSWQLLESPSKNQLNYIKMFSSSKGYIGGRYLLEFDGIEWVISNKGLPRKAIYKLFIAEENNFWMTNTTFTNESELFHFDGKLWKKFYNPFANQIESLNFFKDAYGWIGGDGELAFFDGKRWKKYSYPHFSERILNIFGDNESRVWIQLANHTLYFYDGKNWKQELAGKKVNTFHFNTVQSGWILADDELYLVNNLKPEFHSKNNLLNNINHLYVINQHNIWAVGSSGLILHYTLEGWQKINSPANESLFYIQMLNEYEGWAVGDRGTILHYTQTNFNSKRIQDYGFDQMVVYPFGREVNDEYGIAMEDLNGDGLKDIYAVCIFDPNRFYVNKSTISSDKLGNTKKIDFFEEAAPRGINGVLGGVNMLGASDLYLGVGIADVDNNSSPDLYLCSLTSTNKLFLNDGTGFFRNVSEEKNRAAGEKERSNSAIFGDVDNDGDLDLFVTNENTSNRLYLNDGNGYFTDVTERAGLNSNFGGMGASFGDIDGDGDLDLYVANWYGKNLLYRNETNKNQGVIFIDITQSQNIGGEIFAKSNAVVFADIDNDGDLDLFVTNRKASNRFYLNDGKGNFTDLTSKIIGIDTMLSYGASFADFDNDGFLDLYVANVGDNVLYKNINGKKFIPITTKFDAQLSGYSTGTAVGDIDNDGDVDLYVGNYINGNSTLFINNINNKNFLIVNFSGTKSNRDAIGTKVWLYKSGYLNDKNSLLGFREINGGSGYGSFNSKEIHFGVSDTSFYDLVVYFPSSGIRKIFKHISAGIRLNISEEDGFDRTLTRFSKAAKRFITCPRTHFEFAKSLVIGLLIFASGFRGKKRYKWSKLTQVFYHGIILLTYSLQTGIYFYESFFFSTVLPLISVIVLLSLIHLVYERYVLVKISRQEKQVTRDRIARDLHDDLASTLSSAGIYSEALKRSLTNTSNDQADVAAKINSLIIEASDSITDLVWTVSPQNDKLEDLLLRIRLLISETCKTNSIEYHFEMIRLENEIILSEDLRRNIYLIFKEAINNIAKHSRATLVNFKSGIKNHLLEMELEDNGVGLSDIKLTITSNSNNTLPRSSKVLHGNGLKNMFHRAKEIEGEITISSNPNVGTRITFTRQMTQMRY
ncbi:MAG: FG-GAP-like repeat-containing protein [Ignavibacteriales bacterium]|nr:FG-GAP-like repeat-containing protein [Ignavibacteriales bacterium]